MAKFSWPSYPRTDADFEQLMASIDGDLAAHGLKPFQRPLHVGRKFWEAFGWGGAAVPPKHLADMAGFDGDVLMAKAHRWYEQVYGEQLKGEWAYGHAPVKLANALWRVRAGVTFGTVELFIDRNLANRGNPIGNMRAPATLNVLCAVEELPQGLANRLSDRDLIQHVEFHVFMHESLQWRSELPPTELFQMAQDDYEQSTAAVVAERLGQARWGAQQAVEKTLKGVLDVAGTGYPKTGSRGHDLKRLCEILEKNHAVRLLPDLIALAACSPSVRYGEEASTQEQALFANHAVLGVLEQLRKSPSVSAILAPLQQMENVAKPR